MLMMMMERERKRNDSAKSRAVINSNYLKKIYQVSSFEHKINSN